MVIPRVGADKIEKIDQDWSEYKNTHITTSVVKEVVVQTTLRISCNGRIDFSHCLSLHNRLGASYVYLKNLNILQIDRKRPAKQVLLPVLFQNFGDSSLDFEIAFSLKNRALVHP